MPECPPLAEATVIELLPTDPGLVRTGGDVVGIFIDMLFAPLHPISIGVSPEAVVE